MARKVISTVFYVVAGFLVYMVGVLAFTNMSSLPGSTKPPAWAKLAMMGVFSAPAAVALLAGLAIDRFRHWKRDVGIVLVSGAGVTAFVVLTIACILMSPESRKLFPRNMLDFFSAYIAGMSSILGLIVIGIALIMTSRVAPEGKFKV